MFFSSLIRVHAPFCFLNRFCEEAGYAAPLGEGVAEDLLHLLHVEVHGAGALPLPLGTGLHPLGQDGTVPAPHRPPQPPVHVRVHHVVDSIT